MISDEARLLSKEEMGKIIPEYLMRVYHWYVDEDETSIPRTKETFSQKMHIFSFFENSEQFFNVYSMFHSNK